MTDPFGLAIKDYFETGIAASIKVNSNYTEDEEISVEYLFRDEKNMPEFEITALNLCSGKVLDVGAAAGCHSLALQNKGVDVTSIEQSSLACDVLKKRGINNVICSDIYTYTDNKFDTILLLMNGTGIGGTLNGLRILLTHLKTLLSKNGQIIIDSSDIKYLFEEEDGSYWIDLANNNYYGEMKYEVTYKNQVDKFNWLFVDSEKLREISRISGLNCELVTKGEHFEYLARITAMS